MLHFQSGRYFFDDEVEETNQNGDEGKNEDVKITEQAQVPGM